VALQEMQAETVAVELTDVVKRFGAVTAIDGVSIAVEHGTVVTWLGPSGCGKTTTLRMLAGLERPTSGRVLVWSVDPARVSARERPTSMIFQEYALFPHLNVEDNVAFGLKVRGVGREHRHKRARELLDLLGLGGLERRMPRELSGGQRQRVAMARSLILEPKVLLLDEPLGALDAQVRRQLVDELRSLQRRLGLTFIYVTHDQAEAMALSDRVVVMNRGRVVQDGPPDFVYRRPRTAFVARFLGDCNIVDGIVRSTEGATAWVELGGFGTVCVEAKGQNAALREPAPVKVALRPEDIRVLAEKDGRARALVLDRTFLGPEIRYQLDVSGLRVQAMTNHDVVHDPMSWVGLGWRDEQLSIVEDDLPAVGATT
jgi:ABC-type Fe3+/spermidine/putrescine transport system ATPase subunit